MAKFCGACGAQSNDDARVCGTCGRPFPYQAASFTPPAAQGQTATQPMLNGIKLNTDFSAREKNIIFSLLTSFMYFLMGVFLFQNVIRIGYTDENKTSTTIKNICEVLDKSHALSVILGIVL